jgi:hypothetical protein
MNFVLTYLFGTPSITSNYLPYTYITLYNSTYRYLPTYLPTCISAGT